MRTLLALILGALLPARGKRRSEVPSVPTARAPRRMPAPAQLPPYLCDSGPLVRPYVIEHERRLQRAGQGA